VTIAPLSFVATTTLVAGWESITDIFWPLAQRQETAVQGYINTFLTVTIMTAAVVILADSIRRWLGIGKRLEKSCAVRRSRICFVNSPISSASLG